MKSDRCLRTSSLIIVQSVHLTLPHEFRGRSNRECQDLRLGRLGVPRPARIAARLTLCPRDLPGLRIRLTTVPCILPERLELTWCHRGICRRDSFSDFPGNNTFIQFVQLCKTRNSYVGPLTSSNCFHPQAVDVRGIHHRVTHNLSTSSQVKLFGTGQNTGETLSNFRQKSKGILKKS
ncbi:hypothetical protein Prudu_45S000600 [Prunus dulcis]|uniref:F-box family protein with DUF295 n=1 Tax=Prunus dulcis TaxID=3755 RepID=A0A5H2XLL6_PRUDU|nr:hypothetical protein Prudu_45S000600 [Prunus dulcis]